MAIAIIAIKGIKGKNAPAPRPKTTTTDEPASKINRDRGFDRRISFIKYSKHATCRMKCRHITQAEVEQIMKDGAINFSRNLLFNLI